MAVKMAAKMKHLEYFDTYIPQNNAFGGYITRFVGPGKSFDTISQLIGPFKYFEIQDGRHNGRQNSRQNEFFLNILTNIPQNNAFGGYNQIC
jgi:hypothetical protein